MFHNTLNAEADLRIQMFSIKLNIKEIYTVVKKCHSPLKFFLFLEKIVIYHKNVLCAYNEFVIFRWINTLISDS